MASLIGRQLGGYLIEQEVGRGAMGVVFKAKQLTMDRYVALKFLPTRLAQNPRIVARFLREARAAGQLSHPNLVNVHDAGVMDGLNFIAMEFVDGSAVHTVVRTRGPYSEKEALDIAAQVAAALKAAHAKGILHRDVKPDNFLIDSSGRVRLADLGLAHFQNSEKDNEVSSAGTTVGTPHYMSPEQCSGGTLDERSDLYSLGASLYVLATGQTPFDGPTAAAVMVKALTEPPRSLKELNPQLSAGFVALVGKMIAKDPAQRFQSAQEVLEAIQRISGTDTNFRLFGNRLSVPEIQEDVPLVPLEEIPRHRLLLYGAAAAALALAALWFLAPRVWPNRLFGAAPSAPAAGSTSVPPVPAEGRERDAHGTTEVPQPPPKKSGQPRPLPSALADNTVMDERQMNAVKKLSRLKQDLADKVLTDPDAAIARMQDFLSQHPGPRVANIAQEFLAKAKETKEKLDKDWAESRGAAEKEALAGHKPAAFHILRSFVDAHPGAKPASTALGMMLGWVTDLRTEAAKAAEAGHYAKAVEMLSVTDSKLPAEITAPLQKDLARYTAERDKLRAAVDADRGQLAVILNLAAVTARETDAATGKRFDFEASAQVCRDGLAQLKLAPHRKELEGLAGLYARAARMLDRLRLALEACKSVELPGLGKIKDPVQLSGWDERGLTYKPRLLEAQTMPWREVTADNLLQAALALRVATGKSWNDLLDTGALAFAAGARSLAAEKLEQAAAADPAARALAEPALRLLRPGPAAQKTEGSKQ